MTSASALTTSVSLVQAILIPSSQSVRGYLLMSVCEVWQGAVSFVTLNSSQVTGLLQLFEAVSLSLETLDVVVMF